jgi:hypothetical protein
MRELFNFGDANSEITERALNDRWRKKAVNMDYLLSKDFLGENYITNIRLDVRTSEKVSKSESIERPHV